MSGWIKLHRKIICHWIFQKPEYLHAWITILLKVNHSDKKVLIQGELIECNRGQSLNSLATWTGLFGRGWTMQKTRTFLKLLKNDAMINMEGLRKTTRLTVCNYDSYQDEQHTNNTQTTHKQQGDNKEITTNKNDKNDKNKKIPEYKEFSEYVISNIPDIDKHYLELKYKSWVQNNWKDGNDKPIKNWKSKALNACGYLPKVKTEETKIYKRNG